MTAVSDAVEHNSLWFLSKVSDNVDFLLFIPGMYYFEA